MNRVKEEITIKKFDKGISIKEDLVNKKVRRLLDEMKRDIRNKTLTEVYVKMNGKKVTGFTLNENMGINRQKLSVFKKRWYPNTRVTGKDNDR